MRTENGTGRASGTLVVAAKGRARLLAQDFVKLRSGAGILPAWQRQYGFRKLEAYATCGI